MQAPELDILLTECVAKKFNKQATFTYSDTNTPHRTNCILLMDNLAALIS